LSSCSVVGSGGKQTLSFTKPHKKKLIVVTRGLSVLSPLHTQSSVTKRLYQARIDGRIGGLFPYLRRNYLWTITTDFVS
jgi:hypothetical protein